MGEGQRANVKKARGAYDVRKARVNFSVHGDQGKREFLSINL